MFKLARCFVVAAPFLTGVSALGQLSEGAIVQPAEVTTSYTQVFNGIGRIATTFDQSGLSAPFVSGVTDFDDYIATATHVNSHSAMMLVNSDGRNQPAGVVELGGTITLDLGVVLPIDAVGVWATRIGGELTNRVAVYADTDADFENGGITLLGTYDIPATRSGTPLAFPRIETGFVHLEVLAHGGASFIRAGEFTVRLASETIDDCPGDVDGSGATDLSDLASVLSAFASITGDPTFVPEADFDGDGDVDLSDLAVLLGGFGCGA